MKINTTLIRMQTYNGGGFWVRFGKSDRGFSISNHPPLFSERNGYTKSYPLLFGYRLKFI